MFIPADVEKLIDALKQAGYQACAVGGCVRDSLLGREPKDWDICTAAEPETVCAVFSAEPGIGTVHGTVTVGRVEITTFRRDIGSSDGRRPDRVEFVKDLDTDLKRRDFTVNAMAWDGELHDPMNGKRDLEQKLMRTVGDPVRRFNEDSLRVLRCLRFASVLDFDIEKETEKALAKCFAQTAKLPVERFFSEFYGLLEGAGAQRIIEKYGDVLRVFISLRETDLSGAETAEERLARIFGENCTAELKRLHAPVKIRKAAEKYL